MSWDTGVHLSPLFQSPVPLEAGMAGGSRCAPNGTGWVEMSVSAGDVGRNWLPLMPAL